MKKLLLILLLSSLSSINAMTRFTARNDTDQPITIAGEKTEATVQPHEEKELCLPCDLEIAVKNSADESRTTKVGWHTKLLVAKRNASGLQVSQHVKRCLIIRKTANRNLLITPVTRYNYPFYCEEISYPEGSDPITAEFAANITELEIRRAVPVEPYRAGTPTDRIKLEPMNGYVKDHPDLVVKLENDTDGLLITGGTWGLVEVKQLKLAEKFEEKRSE
jgi:hypothetical protein